MATIPIPLTTLQVGTVTVGPGPIGLTDTQALITIDRTVAGGMNSLPAESVTVTTTIWLSRDSGATWQTLAVNVDTSGNHLSSHTGQPIPASTLQVGIPFPGVPRQARATVEVAGGSVVVVGSLVVM